MTTTNPAAPTRGHAPSRCRLPNLVNLTAHPITLIGVHDDIHLVPSGALARIEHRTTVMTGYLRGIPVLTEDHPTVTGLPEPRADTYWVVSRTVLTACPERTDLLCPGQLVRDENGTVSAARTLITTSATPVHGPAGDH